MVETYSKGFLDAVKNVEAIRQAKFKIIVDYAYAPTSEVLPPILSTLDVEVVPLAAHVDGEKMSVLPEEFDKALQTLQIITGALGAQLGVRLDVGGEKVFLVDHHGQPGAAGIGQRRAGDAGLARQRGRHDRRAGAHARHL